MHFAANDVVGGPKVRPEIIFLCCGDVFVDAAEGFLPVAEGKAKSNYSVPSDLVPYYGCHCRSQRQEACWCVKNSEQRCIFQPKESVQVVLCFASPIIADL
jgi:hypothetical protein